MRIPFLFLLGMGLFLGLTALPAEVTTNAAAGDPDYADLNELLDTEQKIPLLAEENQKNEKVEITTPEGTIRQGAILKTVKRIRPKKQQ